MEVSHGSLVTNEQEFGCQVGLVSNLSSRRVDITAETTSSQDYLAAGSRLTGISHKNTQINWISQLK